MEAKNVAINNFTNNIGKTNVDWFLNVSRASQIKQVLNTHPISCIRRNNVHSGLLYMYMAC